MADDPTLESLAAALVERLGLQRRQVATAESCTGGWIAKSITDIAGSSACFEYGVVSYGNGAKTAMLDVAEGTLTRHGAVSEETATEMARGVLLRANADLSVAVSGIAGPGGGTKDKPVGLVWFAWAERATPSPRTTARSQRFAGDRDAVRRQTVAMALEGLLELSRDG